MFPPTLIASTYWGGIPFWFRRPPANASVTSLALHTDDHRQIRASYWTPASTPAPRVAALVIHPRVDFTHHYMIPRLVEAGVGVLAATTRHLNNDTACEHEELVLDVAACVRWLRAKGGAERVVLLGNCGGGSLVAFFQAQAGLPPAERLARSPGGSPTGFASAEMTPGDGLVLVAAHRGQGQVILRALDAAVVDEDDPLASDESVDIYDVRNGFREPPASSTYAPDFVARVRAAQIERVRRIDARAKALIAAHADARAETERPGFDEKPFADRLPALRRRAHEPLMLVSRTMANPAFTDPSIDADPGGSAREYGSLLSDRPDLMNLTSMGLARVCTPRAWLSTWSGLSSNADLLTNVGAIRSPTLVVHATSDREVFFDRDARATYEASAAADRSLVRIEGARHYFEPPFGEKLTPDVDRLMDAVVPWIRERFA
jgi:alpha/beta superfamily hydrolase